MCPGLFGFDTQRHVGQIASAATRPRLQRGLCSSTDQPVQAYLAGRSEQVDILVGQRHEVAADLIGEQGTCTATTSTCRQPCVFAS
jgi:hypothetical protein